MRIVAVSATLDRVEALLVDPPAALQGGQLFAPGRQPLGLAGDLLGVDRVLLDAGARRGLVVAGPLEGAFLVAHLDLQALARPGLLRDRPQRLEGAGLLLDLEGRRVAERRERRDGLLADEPVELGPGPLDRLDVGVLAGEEVLRGGRILDLDRGELGCEVRLAAPEVVLELGAAPQAAGDLVVAELLLAPEVEGGAAPGPGIGRQEHGDDRGDDPADDRDAGDRRVDHAEDPQRNGDDPADGQDGAQPGERPVARLGDLDLVVDRRRLLAELYPELADLPVEHADPLDELPQHRQGVRRRVASLELGDLGGHGRPPGGSARSAPGQPPAPP